MTDFGKMIIPFMKEKRLIAKGGIIHKHNKKLIIGREGLENERYFTVFSGFNEDHEFNIDNFSEFYNRTVKITCQDRGKYKVYVRGCNETDTLFFNVVAAYNAYGVFYNAVAEVRKESAERIYRAVQILSGNLFDISEHINNENKLLNEKKLFARINFVHDFNILCTSIEPKESKSIRIYFPLNDLSVGEKLEQILKEYE